MTYIARNDQSVVGRWWNEVDRGLIWNVLALIFAGSLIVFTGSAIEALQDDTALFSFSLKKIAFALIAITILFGVSMFRPEEVERLTWLGFTLAIILLLSLFVFGISKNGATRWIAVPGLPFYPQPTEFAKPFMVLALALCLSRAKDWGFSAAFWAATGVFALTAALVAVQPDISQTAFMLVIFVALLFLAGLALEWILMLAAAGVGGLAAAYFTLSHVKYRLDGFLARIGGADGDLRDHNDMAQDAFERGGVAGRGLGEGNWKTYIPEAQNDMPLAIIGEELGLIGALIVMVLFFLVWTRTQRRLRTMTNSFQQLAAGGLAFLFVGQVLINVLYTVGLIPTTGITLPFFSDGGSSLIASALTMGLLLALTRQKSTVMA